MLYQKQVSRAGTSNYTPQHLWDAIHCLCPRYLLLLQHSCYTIVAGECSICTAVEYAIIWFRIWFVTLAPFLLKWFNFNLSMDKQLHTLKTVGWNYSSIPKLQRLYRRILGMKNQFHPTLYNGCDYISMLGLKLNHISKRGYCSSQPHYHRHRQGHWHGRSIFLLQIRTRV